MLAQTVKPSRRLHPLLAFGCALPIFLAGLPTVGTQLAWFYVPVVALLYTAFGYGRAWLKITLMSVPVLAFAALITLIAASPERALLHWCRAFFLLQGTILTMTVEPVDLLRALQQLRFPRLLCIGLLITLRFFSVLAAEIRRIHLALRSRGVGSLAKRPSLLLRAYMMPLMIRLFSLSDLLALSLETRGFHPEGQSSFYEVIRWRSRDTLFSLAVAALVGGGVYLAFFA